MRRRLLGLSETFTFKCWITMIAIYYMSPRGRLCKIKSFNWKQNRMQKTNQANLRQLIILGGPSNKPPFEYQSQVRKAFWLHLSLYLTSVISFQNSSKVYKVSYPWNHKHHQHFLVRILHVVLCDFILSPCHKGPEAWLLWDWQHWAALQLSCSRNHQTHGSNLSEAFSFHLHQKQPTEP